MKLYIQGWATSYKESNRRTKKYREWRNRRNKVARRQRKWNQQHG